MDYALEQDSATLQKKVRSSQGWGSSFKWRLHEQKANILFVILLGLICVMIFVTYLSFEGKFSKAPKHISKIIVAIDLFLVYLLKKVEAHTTFLSKKIDSVEFTGLGALLNQEKALLAEIVRENAKMKKIEETKDVCNTEEYIKKIQLQEEIIQNLFDKLRDTERDLMSAYSTPSRRSRYNYNLNNFV